MFKNKNFRRDRNRRREKDLLEYLVDKNNKDEFIVAGSMELYTPDTKEDLVYNFMAYSGEKAFELYRDVREGKLNVDKEMWASDDLKQRYENYSNNRTKIKWRLLYLVLTLSMVVSGLLLIKTLK